ncbi:MAG: hypothetical protein KDE09_03995 [Anaerolineales bacterium]|nr:hypothetical protein [Anaerolineales bacterium]
MFAADVAITIAIPTVANMLVLAIAPMLVLHGHMQMKIIWTTPLRLPFGSERQWHHG